MKTIAPSQRTVTLKLKRRYVVDLLLACDLCHAATIAGHESGEKWEYLHDVIQQQLQAHDEKQEAEA